MGLTDPTTASDFDSKEMQPLAERIDEVDGKCIGLYDNGKMAAEPVLEVLREKLEEKYPDITIETLSLNNKREIADQETVTRVKEWANGDIDACIGAIGDCGSCTKFLTWGLQAIEEEGVPTVGLVDEGFVLDYQSNAVERGMLLRYNDNAVRSEIRDHDMISERMTPEVIEEIEEELIRPLNERERGIQATN